MRTSATEPRDGSPPPGKRARGRALAIGGGLLGPLVLVGTLAHHGPGVTASTHGGGLGALPEDTILPSEVEGDPDSEDPVERGAYLARAGNCMACHTVEDPEEEDYLAGGNPIESPFGTFYGTNITPHPDHGIGEWDREDLARSLHQGRGPDGTRYYPVFPFPSFTLMREEDVADLHAFLQNIPARPRENRPHDLQGLAGFRGGLLFWKVLHHDERRFQEDPERGEGWNRGAYLARAVAHCSECHSPRTWTGGVDEDMRYAGTADGFGEDETVPNITPHEETGIGEWSQRELVRYLEIGMDPDGDFAGGSMGQVISMGTSHLTQEDLEAVAEYLLSLDPIQHEID